MTITVTTYRKPIKWTRSRIFRSSVNAPEERLENLFSFCKLYSTEKPEISALLACGTDGEKAVVDGFKRNPPYATFLRCFIHYKKNIEEHLENHGFRKDLNKFFLDEIFDIENSDKKLCGRVWPKEEFGMQDNIMCQNHAYASGSLRKR